MYKDHGLRDTEGRDKDAGALGLELRRTRQFLL